MKNLIDQYMEGRKDLRQLLRKTEARLHMAADEDEIMDLKNDMSLINGMIRDMTESISMMRSLHYQIRGKAKQNKVQHLDPEILDRLVPAKWDPEKEDHIRSEIRSNFWHLIQQRMDLLTPKQSTTLERWIHQAKSISDISREDGVSRQAVHVRLFGDRTNKGALRILRDGRGSA